jgi:hypothetical protein
MRRCECGRASRGAGRRIHDDRAAVAVARRDELARHVLAQQFDVSCVETSVTVSVPLNWLPASVKPTCVREPNAMSLR